MTRSSRPSAKSGGNERRDHCQELQAAHSAYALNRGTLGSPLILPAATGGSFCNLSKAPWAAFEGPLVCKPEAATCSPRFLLFYE